MIQQKLFGSTPSFASLTYDIKSAMHEAAKRSRLSREEILKTMNAISNRQNVSLRPGNSHELDKETFEKWLNPEETQRYPSLAALVVFCQAAETVAPLAAMAGLLGARIIDEHDSKKLAWAEANLKAKELRKRMAKLEEQL